MCYPLYMRAIVYEADKLFLELIDNHFSLDELPKIVTIL